MRLLQNIHNFDVIAFSWILTNIRREAAVKFARVISFTADGPLYVIIGLLFIWHGNWAMAKLIAVAFAVERILYFIFKTLFKRNRPPAAIPGFKSVIEPSDQFSFPSGHTSAAFLWTCAMSVAFPWLTWVLLPWACLVGMSRVMLGVHFPTDIIAGAILGSSICTVVIGILF